MMIDPWVLSVCVANVHRAHIKGCAHFWDEDLSAIDPSLSLRIMIQTVVSFVILFTERKQMPAKTKEKTELKMHQPRANKCQTPATRHSSGTLSGSLY